MLLLGIDLGTSSVKVSVVDADTRNCIATAQFPETEADIITPQPGWAEQSPDMWWENVKQAVLACNASGKYDPKRIAAIGIAYQMHGLVLIDKEQQVLRNSIIWCDSRAVEIGEQAFHDIGKEKCLSTLLNSPGNFTAAKLAWVKKYEPAIYDKIHKVMLPGDFIAMELTGDLTTSSSALSEGIFWDFKKNDLSKDITGYFGFENDLFPGLHPLFSAHGYLRESVADRLSLMTGIPVSYKAGDQPNNALALNVLKPGEIAATAGTSGVIYGVSDQLNYDELSRINSFAHVNHSVSQISIGILLCINGAGIFNRWIKNVAGANISYDSLNAAAASVEPGSNGLMALPFGNGAERMLENKIVGAQFYDLDLNVHTTAHMVRAGQEGIAFAFRYGLDIMRENGIAPSVIRAGRSNLFLSDVFTGSFVNANNVSVEFYEGDGSFGAAMGAGIGAGIYEDAGSALQHRKPVKTVEPTMAARYDELYEKWKVMLNTRMESIGKNEKLSLA
jgi:xylulokinase